MNLDIAHVVGELEHTSFKPDAFSERLTVVPKNANIFLLLVHDHVFQNLLDKICFPTL